MQLQIAFGFWSILHERHLQRSEMYPEKMFTPVRFRLPFHTDRETPQVARCDDPKKCSSRQLPAFGQYFSKNHSSDPLRCPEKVRFRTASGFGVKPCEKFLQPSEMYLEKIFRSDCLRLLVDPLQKVSPASGDMPRKNVHARWPLAFGRYSAKSLVSLRKCTPTISFGLSALGCNKDKRNGA